MRFLWIFGSGISSVIFLTFSGDFSGIFSFIYNTNLLIMRFLGIVGCGISSVIFSTFLGDFSCIFSYITFSFMFIFCSIFYFLGFFFFS